MADVKHEVKPESIAKDVEQYVPCIWVEISEEQAEMLEVGKDAVITLKGRVKGLSSDTSDSEDGRYEIQMEMQEVIIDPKDNEFTNLLDDDE